MPEFQRKSSKFVHKGQNWNASVDSIPDGQCCYARNVRVSQQGVITQRPGMTNYVAALPGGGNTHSISRLNNYDADVNFGHGYVIGQDANLYFGATTATSGTPDADIKANLVNGSLNPIQIGLSGNPVTFVDMAPVASISSWKYIGDSNGNFSVGLYPTDNRTGYTKAQCIPMGIAPPVTGLTNFGLQIYSGGKLAGDYQWALAYRNKWTGARSNPSAPTRFTVAHPAHTIPPLPTGGYVSLAMPTYSDPVNFVVDIYRYGGTLFDWHYVGTANCSNGGTVSFEDRLGDAQIETAPGPPQVSDPTTGVQRFICYQPFITQDIARFGHAVVTGGSGLTFFTAQSNPGDDSFNPGWLPGSFISFKNANFSMYESPFNNTIVIAEDPAGLGFTSGDVVKWSTHAGTLTAGHPLPHIWGPYGTGQSGAFIFACGDNNNPGTLFWTNGNDPDSTDLANSLIVTSPSEPLRGGCVYDGTPFVWSTERMFRIYPGSVAGQFTVQEIPGSKGLWAEWSLTVQSNGVSDQSITWVGKDGIYDWSTMGGLRTMTDRDMAAYFPHDNQDGTQLSSLFPFLNEPIAVGVPDYTTPGRVRYHRLTWFQNELFYDYPGLGGGFQTLVYDAKQCQGWVSLDQYSSASGATGTQPICRCNEIADNRLKVGVGGQIMDYTGVTDGGHDILCRFVTRQDDLGEPRMQKLYGDYMLDAQVGGPSIVTIIPRTDLGMTALTTQTLAPTLRTQKIYTTIPTGLGVLSTSFGFDFTWTAGTFFTYLYQYEYTYVPKPEITSQLATDKTDDGYLGAKYLRGLCIEANTFGNDRTVKVLVDGAPAASLTVNTGSQLEVPFAITPLAGSEFQLQPTDGSALWELFTVRWVWEKWPDLTAIQSNWLNLGSSRAKYVRGFTLPISGPATPLLSFTTTYDGTNIYGGTVTAVAPANLAAKSPAQFSFNPPILAHQLKLTPSTTCRLWYEEIVWDAEEWPERATLHGPVENLGDSTSKYIRGVNIPMETNGTNVVMELVYDKLASPTSGTQGVETFPAVRTDTLAKVVFPFTPVTPIIAHELQLRSTGDARFWYSEVKWEYEPWPEFDTGDTPFMDLGTPAAKFMQGLVIPLDTGGTTVTIDLLYDNGQSIAIGPFTGPAGVKTAFAYSYPVPFIAHEIQLSPRTPVRIFEQEIKWVWEPVPELVTTYTTQETDLDLPGWHYLFDAYIAYIGTSNAPNLAITTEYGTINYALPVSNGVFTRAYLMLNPQKAKWRSFSITCSTGIRLFLKDCEVRAKDWTDKGVYPAAFESKHPFGDESRRVGALI